MIFNIPVDKSPSIDLKERIKKTITSCKGVFDDHYKKGSLTVFLEAFIAHVVTAITGDTKIENSKEYKEKSERVAELENELQLKSNIVQLCSEESKRLKSAIELAENKAKSSEKRADELTQKYNKIELLYKDSESRRTVLQTDYTSLLEEVKMLRQTASEKFEIERKFTEQSKNIETTNSQLKMFEEKYNLTEGELSKLKLKLTDAEKELLNLRSEVADSKKAKELESLVEKLKNINAQQEDDLKNKGRRIGELTIELEEMKTKFVNIKTEFEDFQASQDLVLKKNANDIKEIRRQYNKEKEISEQLSQLKQKLEKENKELKDRVEILQRNSAPAKSVTQKEKAIVEALSTRLEFMMDENEKLKNAVSEHKKKLEHYETESKVQLQLLVNYAGKYAQDHLEEYKDMYFLSINY